MGEQIKVGQKFIIPTVHLNVSFCLLFVFQSSRELLQSFSGKYLGGEGDIIRHLAHFGYAVTHTQVPA